VNAGLAAEALFVSPLQPSAVPGPAEVDAAITAAILLHGSCGCAAMVAQEFGDHPDLAAARMRWAITTVHSLFQPAPV
jgi:hypothetical protein